MALILLGTTSLPLRAGVYTQTKHGNPTTGVLRVSEQAAGECSQCHDEHASRQGASNGGPFEFLLFSRNDNTLCSTCHNAPGALGIYPGGSALWAQSSHATSSRMIWPGPAPQGRPSSDAGKCVNCHDPHGAQDRQGLIPAQAVARGQSLCIPCHDGSLAQDVRSDFRKTFVHPTSTANFHDEAEGGDSSRFGRSRRHSECVDCHNPHAVQGDPAPLVAPQASARLLGVSRVRVVNGAAGTLPTYVFVGPEDTAFAQEYELCFKCHSSWTTRPAGQSDLALLLNTRNPSFHPVEGQGTNKRIDPLAFSSGWTWDRLTYCSDCHGGDGTASAGPHGSNFRYILKANYATASRATSAPTDLCFGCHSFQTYANPTAPRPNLRASRFNPPNAPEGHAFHVAQGVSCFACHESHGSTQLPSLIAIGRAPGLVGFRPTASGGLCTTSCHGVRTYSVNYGR